MSLYEKKYPAPKSLFSGCFPGFLSRNFHWLQGVLVFELRKLRPGLSFHRTKAKTVLGLRSGHWQSQDRTGPDRTGSDRIGSNRIGLTKVGPDRTGSDRIGSNRIGLTKVGPDQ